MPFVPAPNILQVEVRAIKDGQRVENRFYVNCFHAPTLADITAVNAIVSTSTLTDWIPLLPTDVTLVSNFYRSLQDQNAIQLEAPYVTGNVGTRAGAAAPNQNTLCVSLRSANAGRSARGRLYWLGLSEDQYAANQVAGADIAAITAALDDLRTALVAGGYAWTIVSFFTNNAPRVGGPVYFPVVSVLTVDGVLDSQRRRMPGHGT